jgi:hypothetical protein
LSKDNERFVLYEYLLFYWRKKWFLLPLPIIFILLAIVYSYIQDRPFVGQATIYMGAVEKDSLTQADLVKKNLEQQFNLDQPSFFVTQNNDRIILNLIGNNKNEIEESLKTISEAYKEDLTVVYEKNKALQKEHIAILKEKINSLKNSISRYKNLLEDETLNPTLERRYFDLLQEDENRLVEYIDYMNEEQTELLNLEKPQVVDLKVTQQKSYLSSNLLIAVVLGCFLSLLFIALWKYISDARRETGK